VSSEEIHQRVRDLYAVVDAEVAAAGPRCDASGRCCRFKEWGHVLFLSQLEAEVLLASAPPYALPVSADFCPFQKDNLCTAREPRPLGCRIYFCDPAYQETGNQIMESALSKLKQIAREHEIGWRYAPLHVFLNEADMPAQTAGSIQSDRVPLPLVASRVTLESLDSSTPASTTEPS
jgi:Fe-S-cluster containining protein